MAFTDPWTRDQLAACLGPGLEFLVATLGAEIVGYAVARRAVDEGEILNLGVAPQARRAGVGRALVRAILERLAAGGARTVYLEVRESNLAALGLYQSEGFRAAGRRRAYYRRPVEDAIVLRAAIAAAGGVA